MTFNIEINKFKSENSICTKKANVIFFVTSLDNGGLENYLLRYVKSENNKFNKIIIVSKKVKKGIIESEFKKIENVSVIKKSIGNFAPFTYIKLIFWFKKHFKDYTICDFTGNFSGPILWAANIAGLSKRIVFYRSSSNRFKEDKVRLLINKYYNWLVIKNATNILANSNEALNFFFGNIKDKRFKVIYNGFNVHDFLREKENLRNELGISNDTIVIGHTGRYNPAKNHPVLLKIADIILHKYNNIFFILCGNNVKTSLKSQVNKLRHNDRILLFNDRYDIPKFLNTCDIFIFPSITEGQPNSLIEAWLMGIPFVASNISPIKDILPLEFHNYLVEPSDIDKYIIKIKDILKGSFDESARLNLANWAKNTFAAEIRFKEFTTELIT